MIDLVYSINIKASAEKEMNKLPEETFSRITEAILNLETNPSKFFLKI